jgi:hypothetical protein
MPIFAADFVEFEGKKMQNVLVDGRANFLDTQIPQKMPQRLALGFLCHTQPKISGESTTRQQQKYNKDREKTKIW